MQVISLRRLREFWERHSEAEQPLRDWHRMMEAKRYATPHEVRQDFPSVSFLKNELTIFNIKPHRLIVYMRYRRSRVYVSDVVTHDEYERLIKAGLLG
jgi:mRNA interferase HigB